MPLIKMILVVVYQRPNGFLSSVWSDGASRFSGGHDSFGPSDGNPQRSDSQGRIEPPYRDDEDGGDRAPSSYANIRGIEHAVDRDPVVQPSRLHNEGNEWRDVGGVA